MSTIYNLAELRNKSIKNLRQIVQQSPIDTPTIKVKVEARRHCNLDSLPLRFGFFEQADFVLEITPHSDLMKSNKPDRHLLNGEITNPRTGKRLGGQFVITRKLENGYPILITAWRYGLETEMYLSETMRQLRQDGLIDSEWLLEQHEKYDQGEIRSSGDLVALLAQKLTSEQLESAEKSEKSVHTNFQAEVEEAERLLAEEKSESNKKQQRIDFLEEENERLKAEKICAESRGSTLQITKENTLIRVDEDVLHRGSSCTAVHLSNGETWYMKTSTFDPDLKITDQAKLLLNQKVRLSSWDPVSDPGKWSSQFYFREIYLAE